MHLRREIPFPCEQHGNPAEVTAQNLAWLHFYDSVRDYSDFRAVKIKDKDRTMTILNVPVLKILCEELQIDFLEAFSRLNTINRIFNEAGG